MKGTKALKGNKYLHRNPFVFGFFGEEIQYIPKLSCVVWEEKVFWLFLHCRLDLHRVEFYSQILPLIYLAFSKLC